MAESSDNDDLPDLVESSDEDSPAEKKVKKTNGNNCQWSFCNMTVRSESDSLSMAPYNRSICVNIFAFYSGYLFEVSHRGSSNEYPQNVFVEK